MNPNEGSGPDPRQAEARSPDPANSAEKEKLDHHEPVDDYAHPSTHQMLVVGRRRADAEAKLQQQQREARAKPAE
jgi:hypothetical protein